MHVFEAEDHVQGVLHVQVPAEPVTLQAKLAMLVSQLMEGDAAELQVAPP